MLCPHCQQTQSTTAKFCANCGQPLMQQAPPQQPPVWQPPAPQQQVPVWQPPAPQQQAQSWQPSAPAPRAGRPAHIWLLAACAIALVALFLPWYSTQAYSSVSWKTTGYQYSDGSRSTWDVPEGRTSFYGGGNGFSFFTFLLTAGIGGLALRFRSGAWPRWAGFTLAALIGLVLFVGVVNALYDPNVGPLLFAVAGAVAVPGCLQAFRSRTA